MILKELARVFDGSTILYIKNEYEETRDKKCAKFIEKSNYADREVVLANSTQAGILNVWVKEFV